MCFEISLLVETPTTDGATVRFLSGVDPQVLCHLVLPAEAFAAVGAAVRLLAAMRLHVSLQVIGGHKAQVAE